MTAGTRKSFPAFRMKMCGPFDIRPVSLAAEAIKCVVRTCRDIKTGWCSPRRVADFGMAPAWNWYAADDGASNLLLWCSGSLRMTLVLRRRAGGHHCKCKHNGRNNRNDCFHRGSLPLFAGHAFQQGRPSFATAAPPLKVHGEVMVAFAGRDPHIFPHWPDRFQCLMA